MLIFCWKRADIHGSIIMSCLSFLLFQKLGMLKLTGLGANHKYSVSTVPPEVITSAQRPLVICFPNIKNLCIEVIPVIDYLPS